MPGLIGRDKWMSKPQSMVQVTLTLQQTSCDVRAGQALRYSIPWNTCNDRQIWEAEATHMEMQKGQTILSFELLLCQA